MKYNWQHPEWPEFKYDLFQIQDLAYAYAVKAGKLKGRFDALDPQMRQDPMIDLMVSEAHSTSSIEGEFFDTADIRSSIERELGLGSSHPIRDPRSNGVSKLMVSVRDSFADPLTETLLCAWQDLVIVDPFRRKHMEVGKWRTGNEPMRVISGKIGSEVIHFEAPPSKIVAKEMKAFLAWYQVTSPLSGLTKLAGPIRAAIAHLHFESIHPFEDGNGRVGRAIVEKALSEDIGAPVQLGLSTVLHAERKEYYAALAHASRCDMEITPWLIYFIQAICKAQTEADAQISFVFLKARFWKTFQGVINARQEKVIRKMFQAGRSGFEGGMNAGKYMKMVDCSKATATRDLAALLALGCLRKQDGEGRSTRYELNLPGDL